MGSGSGSGSGTLPVDSVPTLLTLISPVFQAEPHTWTMGFVPSTSSNGGKRLCCSALCDTESFRTEQAGTFCLYSTLIKRFAPVLSIYFQDTDRLLLGSIVSVSMPASRLPPPPTNSCLVRITCL